MNRREKKYRQCIVEMPQTLVAEICSALADSARHDHAEIRIRIERIGNADFGVELKYGGTSLIRVRPFLPENLEWPRTQIWQENNDA